MKKFTKLALISSMAISANAMAMQAMDDSALSATTGQDGINIGIGISKITIDKLYVHDNDGLSATATNRLLGEDGVADSEGVVISNNLIKGGTGTAGALFISNINIEGNRTALLKSHNLMDLQIDSDKGVAAQGGAFLNIAAQVSGLDITLGDIGVAASGDTNASGIQRGASAPNTIIDSGLKIKTGQMAANIQLGAAPQGAMIQLDTTMKGGLTIENLSLADKGEDGLGKGKLWLGKIQVADSRSNDLAISANISVKENGLVITSKHADNWAGTDVYVQGIRLGTAPDKTDDTIFDQQNNGAFNVARGTSIARSIGDVEIQGMKTWSSAGLGSIITITGRN